MFLLVLISPAKVHAQNKIESIRIEADIQEDGSVTIRDHRIFYAEKGTEHYISLGNLGDSKLLSFYVYDENNEILEYAGAWDVNASFSEKTGKYGINKTANETELCFGLGAYGRREFTIEYTISNFIKNLTDGHQAFYWQFINPDMDPIDDIEIDVINDVSYKYEYPESRVWGFGHDGGNVGLSDDALSFTSGSNFRQKDYVVLLGIFEGAPFATDASSGLTSDELIERAMKGTSQGGGSNVLSALLAFFAPVFFILVPLLLVITGLAKKTKKQMFRPTATNQYYREVPYDKHFIDTQYFTNSQVSDWISAFILKWITEGRLISQTEEVGMIFKRDKLALRIVPNLWQDRNELEGRLWGMLLAAAGSDQILAEKEFNRYIKRNLKIFNSWTEAVEEQSKTTMKYAGYLQEFTEKNLKIFTRTKIAITPMGQDLGDKIVSFKNYLKDFSLLEERGVSHVVLWQELMVWAAYMGIAKEVYEQLRIVDPQIEYKMPYNTSTIIMTHAFANSVQSTLTSANSGAGGGSFGGGGGGASGGGSGGGTR